MIKTLRMKRLLFCLTMLPLATALADHNALLPRPQQVQYGSGTLALQGLSIQFASPPSAEDLFAAEQLASRLSAIGQTKVEIKQGESSGKSIVLNRTGEGGALPVDNESTGPDSRESYTLQVTPERGRDSGAQFGGCLLWRADLAANGGGHRRARQCCRWRKSRIGRPWPIAGS